MNILIEPLAYLILISPLLIIGKKKDNWEKHYLIVFALYMILDYVVIVLPIHFEYLDFIDLKKNWTGKIFSYVLAAVFLLSYKRIPLKEFGLTLVQKEGSRSFAVKTTIIILIFMIGYCFFIGRHKASIENIMFQLIMPSIVEEIADRGVLLTLLSMIFISNLKIGKTYFGMGVIITAVLFGLFHGLNIKNDLSMTMNWVLFIYTGVLGFVFALVKERTGSLVYPVLLHIIVNIVPNTMGYVF